MLFFFQYSTFLLFLKYAIHLLGCILIILLFQSERDWMKYEVARKLHNNVDNIRSVYINDLKSKEINIRQRSVALYLIDKVLFYYSIIFVSDIMPSKLFLILYSFIYV